jgi:glucose-6-phosphate isomerase
MTTSHKDHWKEAFVDTVPFEQTKSSALLLELAKNAPDLSVPNFITEERITSMSSFGAGVMVVYGLQRVNNDIFSALQALAEERQVFKQMQSLFSGKPVNFVEGFSSKGIPALHPITRDIFELAITADHSSRMLIENELQKLRSLLDEMGNDFDTLIFIGIGGSELGPHAIAEALEPLYIPGRSVRYVANVDPDDMATALKGLNLKRTLVAVVSKSGTTLETATNETVARHAFERSGLNPSEHFVAITMPQTPMDDKNRYRAVLHLFDFIGGRFSTTSMVGGLLISFLAGLPTFFELLNGANEMDQVALRLDARSNLPLLLALLGVWNRNFLGYPTTAIIPYSRALRRFPAHLQQCDMESNGKSVARTGVMVPFKTGSIVWGEPGTNAQHSFFQLLHQGTDVVPIEFIGFRDSQYGEDVLHKGTYSQEKLVANMFAQAIALAVGKGDDNPNKRFLGNRPSVLILAKKLDARTLGALLSLYEHKIAFQGFLWGINSFDQEGVQLGKVIADQLLMSIQARREKKFETNLLPVGQRLFDILDTIGTDREKGLSE